MPGRYAGHATHRPHGSGIRGLSPDELGAGRRFGNLLPPLERPFDERALQKLAVAMSAEADPPEDGPDDEEGHIPAAYTYFGQFVDHDITFDPSTFQQQRQEAENFRTPRLDLDCLYGRGPADQPYLYDGIKLLLGQQFIPTARNPQAHDLPRAASNSLGVRRAIIDDPRNDENVIVSQLHGLLLKFHNAVADRLADAPFAKVQEVVRWHYQWVVLHDFLPRIVDRAVLNAISPAIANPEPSLRDPPPKLLLFPAGMTFMPVEFSVAAYRLGHAMVRPGYRLNERTRPLAIFDPDNPTNGLNAFGEFPKSWAIDWQRFIDLGLREGPETDTDRVQRAYHLDTSLVEPLARLPKSVAGDEAEQQPALHSLAFRNLWRGNLLRLPTGQEAAAALQKAGVPVAPLAEDEIIIGPLGAAGGEGVRRLAEVSPEFRGRAPLWPYILAEARHLGATGDQPARLSGVGGRLLAEVFVSLLLRDRTSFVHQAESWKPTLGGGCAFSLADIIRIGLAGK